MAGEEERPVQIDSHLLEEEVLDRPQFRDHRVHRPSGSLLVNRRPLRHPPDGDRLPAGDAVLLATTEPRGRIDSSDPPDDPLDVVAVEDAVAYVVAEPLLLQPGHDSAQTVFGHADADGRQP